MRVRFDALNECSLTVSPSSEYLPGGNTGEIEAAKKGTGHTTSHADGSGYVSSLAGTPLRTKVYGTTLTIL